MLPFQIAVDDTALEDLKVRLADARLPQTLDDVGWDYGIDAGFLRRLISHWGHAFVWRAAEARLNGKRDGKHSGLCLEDQNFADAVHNPHFPSVIHSPERPYSHWCEFEIA